MKKFLKILLAALFVGLLLSTFVFLWRKTRPQTTTYSLVSPRTDTLRRRHYEKCLDVLRGWGLHVRRSEHLYGAAGGWFNAPDSVRGADLQRMIDNPNLRAILFFRGGYGKFGESLVDNRKKTV